MSDLGSTVWPNDIVREPRRLERSSPFDLICFLLSPFDPPDRWDEIHEAVKYVCTLASKTATVNIQCRRANNLAEAKAIHEDIWRHISAADFLILDVTGLNPNVMIELGVAATLRRPGQVILIRDATDVGALPFNAFAQRFLPYRRKIAGDNVFVENLHKAIIHAITPAPYVPDSLLLPCPKQFRLEFKYGDRPDTLLSPGILHRRIVDGCLEFGSFYIYRHSWLQITTADYRNAELRVIFRFGEVMGEMPGSFFGFSLRNQGYFANYGYLALVQIDGKVAHTWPKDDRGTYGQDFIGGGEVLPDFDFHKRQFIELAVTFTDESLVIKAKVEGSTHSLEKTITLSEMPHGYSAGKFWLQTSLCRAQIREMEFRAI